MLDDCPHSEILDRSQDEGALMPVLADKGEGCSVTNAATTCHQLGENTLVGARTYWRAYASHSEDARRISPYLTHLNGFRWQRANGNNAKIRSGDKIARYRYLQGSLRVGSKYQERRKGSLSGTPW